MNNREKGTIFKISTLIQLTQFAVGRGGIETDL
jgi:hypothetical protein